MSNSKSILFITQNDPFYIIEFFKEFLKNYKKKERILEVVICPTMGKKSLLKTAKQMLDFYGFFDFCRMVFRYFFIIVTHNTLESLLKKEKIKTHKESDINSLNFVAYCETRKPDVIISVAAPVKFKKVLLQVPTWGCLNVHHAILPFYKGMMPNFWQMYHSEEKVGITVHKMNAAIDEGDIVFQKEVPLIDCESLNHLIRRTKKLAANCIIQVLKEIENDSVVFITKPKDKGTYFSFPNRNDVLEFKRRGYKLL